ncbi:MAG TPA: cytochrome P450 [Candidatus Limnocylindria bacterium]|nr:cytochrome P450 [Candidatus Limnocylindria bacterium]
MTPTPVLSVDEIDFADPAFWARPPAERDTAFATLRAHPSLVFHREYEIPGFPKGPGYWSLVRHEHVTLASRRPDLFCSGQGTQIPDQPQIFNEAFGSMINMDDPRHARLRRIVSGSFTPRMLKRVERQVQEAAGAVIDAVAERGACDFVTDIAAALPLRIICDMMGIPESQYGFVFDRTNVILGAGDPEYVSDPAAVAGALLTAGAELTQLVQELGRLRCERPTDDLTSALVNSQVDGDSLSESDLGSFFVLLVVAGNETTRNAISHGMKALCDFPAERARWMADFEGLAPTAVEEIVRWATPVMHFRRTATRDTEIGGQPIRAGDKVVLWYTSANRDEAVFDDPYRFDVGRTPNDHVGFGAPGPHFCLGANLARREITVMFRELFQRLPDLQITGEPARLLSGFINGIKHMPCEFTPVAPARR